MGQHIGRHRVCLAVTCWLGAGSTFFDVACIWPTGSRMGSTGCLIAVFGLQRPRLHATLGKTSSANAPVFLSRWLPGFGRRHCRCSGVANFWWNASRPRLCIVHPEVLEIMSLETCVSESVEQRCLVASGWPLPSGRGFTASWASSSFATWSRLVLVGVKQSDLECTRLPRGGLASYYRLLLACRSPEERNSIPENLTGKHYERALAAIQHDHSSLRLDEPLPLANGTTEDLPDVPVMWHRMLAQGSKIHHFA